MHVRPHTTLVWVCSRSDNMSFLDIKDPAERATLVKEYVTAIKTVKQRNKTKRESELPIGVNEELQTYFRPGVNATKLAAETTREEFELMKKTLADINGPLAQRIKMLILPLVYTGGDGKLVLGNKLVQHNENI